MRQSQPMIAFNRGIISRLGLARIDVKRLAMAAETMNNWVPRVLGSMMLRPGLKYTGATRSNLASRSLEFIFSADDKARIELTNAYMRVWIDDALISRPAITSTLANGNFTSNIASWTASAGATHHASGYLQLLGNGTTYETAFQEITVAGANIGVEHALRIVVQRGPVVLRVGSASGGDQYIGETTLDTGTHSLALTPTGNFFVQFQSRLDRVILVDSCNLEAVGVMEVPAPWLAADLGKVRTAQSGDILFCASAKATASAGYPQYKIERRAARSWSVVKYQVENGPFRNENVSPTTLTPSVSTGNGTLTASAAMFRSTHVDALFSITSEGQRASRTITAANQFTTTNILIEGVSTERAFTVVLTGVTVANHFVNPTAPATQTSPSLPVGRYVLTVVADGAGGSTVAVAGNTATITGAGTASLGVPVTFQVTVAGTVDYTVVGFGGSPNNVTSAGSATVTLQRSLNEPGTWLDVKTWAAATTESYNDALDNQTAYYRIGVKTGEYGGQNIAAAISISIGGSTGVCRVVGYTSPTVVDMEVLSTISDTSATDVWSEGAWSDYRGWPSSVAFVEGRLGWFGKDATQLSVSDDFYNFDVEYEGDAGPILRTIGGATVETIHWAIPLQRLLLGGEMAEHSCRSSSLDEPLTPGNFNIKKASRQGSAPVGAVAIDDEGIYVQRGGTRIFLIAMSNASYDYASSHLSALIPSIGSPGIVRMAVQRQPDTRVHFVRSDGTVALLVFDRFEEVTCFLTIDSTAAGGFIEDVVILPGDDGDEEDHVYYTVRRTINGSTVRYHERWAFEADCTGGTLNQQADSFVTFTNSPASATVTGLTHAEGASVVVWADGKCLTTADGAIATFTVTGGQISLTNAGVAYAATTGVVGLAYTAQWKSGKPGLLQSMLGAALKDEKRIDALGLIIADAHPKGLQFGPDFDHLDDLPSMESGYPVDPDTIRADLDEEAVVFPGVWQVDARLCLQANAPRPVTVLAAIPTIES